MNVASFNGIIKFNEEIIVLLLRLFNFAALLKGISFS